MAIDGAHVIIYSRDADADRRFFRDVLDYPHVDAGHGWLIFRLPPTEIAVHPGEADGQELYFMCYELDATLADLDSHGVTHGAIEQLPWGRLSHLQLPGGGRIGIYEPRHLRATNL